MKDYEYSEAGIGYCEDSAAIVLRWYFQSLKSASITFIVTY